MKPIVIAICGKSASGKNYTQNQIVKYYKSKNVPVNKVVSYTTRPPREGEVDGEDYHFINSMEFMQKKHNHEFLECAEFRDWYYGTSVNSFKKNSVNVCVLNPQGVHSLSSYGRRYTVIYVYLDTPFIIRMIRSYKREHKFKLEYLRRAWTDHNDFGDKYCFDVWFGLGARAHDNYLWIKTKKVKNPVCKIVNNLYVEYCVNELMCK